MNIVFVALLVLFVSISSEVNGAIQKFKVKEQVLNLKSLQAQGRVFPAHPAIFLEGDPVGDVLFKDLNVNDNQASRSSEIYLPWDSEKSNDKDNKNKNKYVAATRAMKAEDFGVKDPELDPRSQELTDPQSVKRECPHQRCPRSVKCADETMHCCKSGNFSFCCPTGSTCLTTKVPMCLQEPINDPHACTTEVCRPDFHCPLSQVSACCIGGSTCCPVNAKCSGGDPPTCKVLSPWDYLTQPQPDPVPLIKRFGSPLGGASQLTAAATPFRREPFQVIEIPKPTPAPSQTPYTGPLTIESVFGTAAPATATTALTNNNATTTSTTPTTTSSSLPSIPSTTLPPQIEEAPDQPADQIPSMFTDTPTRPGTRTRQKAMIVNDSRIVTTEVQTTIQLPDGGLKTVSKIHREVTRVQPESADLWGSNSVQDSFSDAFKRMPPITSIPNDQLPSTVPPRPSSYPKAIKAVGPPQPPAIINELISNLKQKAETQNQIRSNVKDDKTYEKEVTDSKHVENMMDETDSNRQQFVHETMIQSDHDDENHDDHSQGGGNDETDDDTQEERENEKKSGEETEEESDSSDNNNNNVEDDLDHSNMLQTQEHHHK